MVDVREASVSKANVMEQTPNHKMEIITGEEKKESINNTQGFLVSVWLTKPTSVVQTHTRFGFLRYVEIRLLANAGRNRRYNAWMSTFY